MKTDIQTVIILLVSIWTVTSLLFGWLLIASERRHRKRQKHYELVEKWLNEAARK